MYYNGVLGVLDSLELI